ncbi:hypothetical protein [Rickettsia endosymbiont of Cantharis rufa]|uniref:hypothetical protein n=1 Tax=Rickettsia endosymbiont of Cantharis rufa TaxID=3066248 RepID=UPI00313351F8
MQGRHEACCILVKVNAIGFYQQKDEYSAVLLTLIGYKLGNQECQQFVAAAPTKYAFLEHTANYFVQNYIGRSDITFDDAILSSACSDTLNTSILGDPNYNNMYNLG